MKITKFGHCCLFIEENGVHILTDPGNYCEIPLVAKIDIILITHEHEDHCHVPTIQDLVRQHPDVHIITHDGVGRVLEEHAIPYKLIHDTETQVIHDIRITGYGTKHACIHPDFPEVTNTGFLVAEKLFYPGDSLTVPQVEVEVLALPIAGPWIKIQEAVEYVKKIKPRMVFPVHDGMLRQDYRMRPTRFVPTTLLTPEGIVFKDMHEGSTLMLKD